MRSSLLVGYQMLAMLRRRSCIVAVLACAGLTLWASAPANATQNPRQALVSSGGTVAASSATHRVSGSVGQIASTRSQSATHTVAGGFWNSVWLCDCTAIGDMNSDGVLNVFDVVMIVDIAFRNGPIPSHTEDCPVFTLADCSCDGSVTVIDVVIIVGVAFRNTDDRCDACVR